MFVSRNRLITGCTALLVAGVLAACSDQSPSAVAPSPQSPSFTEITPLDATSVSTLWDFADILISGQPGPVDAGPSVVVPQTDLGAIVAFTTLTSQHVTVKGGDLPLDETERGLGICQTVGGATCTVFAGTGDQGDEVGDTGPGTLILNFDGVQPTGSIVTSISLGSVQDGEGYVYSISTDCGMSFGTPIEATGDGSNNSIVDIPINLPAACLQIKFEKDGTSQIGKDDYTIRSATTEFTPAPELLQGRMTGGGVKATGTAGGSEVPVTLGLTLHCDITLSNNLEVNWTGHQWHLTKPITTASCSNQDNDAPPPASPIDTFEGTAFGSLDGVGGSLITFNFQDHGEPGSGDMIELTIYNGGTTSSGVALQVPLQNLNIGNFQMHFDQPHGQKP
ncbi:MAG TPA: hypothetical protein VFW98_07525 [Gemmatimonadaceae bacterium]|nr:hypothetical protein [Gemmatimonadaceae bacterium]